MAATGPGEATIRQLIDVARTGLDAAALHPLRSAVCVAVVTATLTPYLAGMGLARGLEAEAEAAVAEGADVYVRGSRFGRAAPLPLAAVDRLRAIPGVDRAVPRIVGEVALGKDQVRCVLVGLPAEHFPAWAAGLEGRAPGNGGPHQLVLGAPLARRLGLKVGARVPPFYRNDRLGERTSEVVGVFTPSAPVWQARLVLTTFESAAAVFDQPGAATDILLYCAPEARAAVARAAHGGPGDVRTEVVDRDALAAELPLAARHRDGVFALHFVLAVVGALLVLLATSGLGLSERRREIGILKAVGWQTDELLLRGLAEGLVLSATAAAASLVLAWAWLRGLNGYGLTAVYLVGLDADAGLDVPFRLTPTPAALGFVLSAVVVLTGTLASTWRAAAAPPRLAMR